MRLEQKITVKIYNSKVVVGGREYDVPHALIIGADSVRAEISPDKVYIEASFDRLPETEKQNDDIIKVVKSNSRYEVDTVGETVELEVEGSTFKVQGRVVSIRFDVDYDRVSVKLPKTEKMSGGKMKILVEGYSSSINVIITPFVMGIMNIYNAKCSASTDDSKGITITCT